MWFARIIQYCRRKKINQVVRQLYPPLQANYIYDYGGSPISCHASRISFINAITVA